jgi:hypothetical protein
MVVSIAAAGTSIHSFTARLSRVSKSARHDCARQTRSGDSRKKIYLSMNR